MSRQRANYSHGILYGGNGFDTLDYSSYGAAITVNLQLGGATTGATGGLAFFDSIVGSSAATNRLIGPNATTKWKLTAPNAGTVGSVAYSGFANLRGGTGADT